MVMTTQQSSASGFVNEIAGFFGFGSPRPAVEKRAERRSHERMHSSFDADIEGPNGTMAARGLNIDRQGLGVVCNRPLAPGSLVFAHVKSHRLLGFAHVRNCRPRGSQFAIGLEFRGEPMQQEIGTWTYQHISVS